MEEDALEEGVNREIKGVRLARSNQNGSLPGQFTKAHTLALLKSHYHLLQLSQSLYLRKMIWKDDEDPESIWSP